MELNPALAADLALLSDALDEAGISIAEGVRRLATDVRLAVASYLGLRVLTSGRAVNFAFNVLDEAADVRASILIPVARLGGPDSASAVSVILYAGHTGAFVDLAADLAWLTGVAVEVFAVDQHLLAADGIDAVAGVRRVSDESVINQAIGALISRGLLLEQADAELDSRSATTGIDRRSAAQSVLDEV